MWEQILVLQEDFGYSAALAKTVHSGRVAERLKAPVLKTGEVVIPPWVQIPPLPPFPFYTLFLL
jgi:hypothetical protein